MPAFTGQLRRNEIQDVLFNMIISQFVFTDNIAGTNNELVDMSRVDGSLYGDTKLYYSTDVIESHPWLNDAEAPNLLALDRPQGPEVQALVFDVFRQIRVTTDNYLSKRAFSTEGVFAEFIAVTLGWMRDTKRVYDSTLFNTYVGTAVSPSATQNIEINYPAIADGATNVETEAYNRAVAQAIATRMADLQVALKDPSRDYNDYGHLRSYNLDDLIVVWNAEAANKIRYNDLPTIFNMGAATPPKFEQFVLPAKYFGTIDAVGGTVGATTVRSLYETDYIVGGTTYHVFPGQALPQGAVYQANVAYTEDSTVLFKIMHRRSVPIMSAFEVGTTFFNPRSLTENHYLTWGHNTLEYLKNYPFITVKGVPNEVQ